MRLVSVEVLQTHSLYFAEPTQMLYEELRRGLRNLTFQLDAQVHHEMGVQKLQWFTDARSLEPPARSGGARNLRLGMPNFKANTWEREDELRKTYPDLFTSQPV